MSMTTSLLEALQSLLSVKKRRLFHTFSPRSRHELKRQIQQLAKHINSLEPNFPVPSSKRDVNSRSAIFSLDGLSDIA